MNKFWISLILLFSLALGSCGPVTPPPSTPSPDSPTVGEPTPMTPLQQTPASTNMQTLVKKATDDLSKKLGVSEDQIKLVKASEVTWGDGSLGCPQKGMAYIEMLISGYLVVLEVDNIQYEYHSGKDGNLSYCQNPTPPANGDPGGTY
ncbi:MAG: hypothetical protein HZB50_18610 [Chloroflexi bacterium]|nr:hypothetical protein [Chloroflexota bacterium]